ncbi:NlpC/P60 family protein [Streptomyces sp. NPDC060194]|uniref:C40 family peptidase n=1 Tax=Streptomyces sp. NPDC060194 TaxID=3347069 RepID=UPI003661BABB
MRRTGGTRGFRSVRRRVLAAVAGAAAVAVLAVGATAPAHAAPVPEPAPAAAPAGPLSDKSLEQVRKDIDALYQQAASATDAYNAAEADADRQAKEVSGLTAELLAGEKRLKALRNRAGASARAQYRTGGLPPEADVMLSGDAQHFLDTVGRIRSGQQATNGLIAELTRTQEDLELYAQDANTEWERLEESRDKKERAKKQIEKGIAAATRLEARLAASDRARLRELEAAAAREAQAAWLASGGGPVSDAPGSARGERAVAWALAQVGKPYVWGAEGPDAFDCSGLTSEAWRAAGKGIPRTSQLQWRSLPRVAMTDIRPGDLIVYRADASHVAMYIGDGRVVHSPRPGRTVTVTGAGANPILGVVRPG